MTKWLCAMVFVGVAAFLAVGRTASESAPDPLPSWNDGPRKQAVLDFVAKVTREGGPDFVPVPDRIAVFDNDGTLWSEQPMYAQLAFGINQVKVLVKDHPEWKEKLPFKAALEGDLKNLMASGLKGVTELVLATHANQTTDEFETTVKKWIASSRHPRFKRPYNECVYQPMLE
ncbi:MAG: haloacid dehalogenase-like hydrolase, partial [Gemmataceae bacterium]